MTDTNFILSANGVRVPGIIYGTAWKKEHTARLVEQALEAGFRGIDTACQPKHYHEAGVGDALSACVRRGLSRDRIYLQTKFTPLNGHDPLQIPYDPDAVLAEQVSQSFQASLRNLQTDYLDCLVLHSPLADRQQLLEVWRAMEGIFQAGGAKQLGISNCYEPEVFKFLYQAATVKPAVIQNRFYADTDHDRDIRQFCRQQGVIYQSFWTLTANPKILADTVIQDLATTYQRSSAQIFFRYLTQIGIVPLTGTSSVDHMRADLAIFEFKLTEDECAEIQRLL
ncbi:aldo/keto reductase [Methylomonas sp. LL1]|uniref:aldo/keto reductase family protein n=1 Tax=Methylomonas sp. LL1 TaxID=2785785 RepID=UPI0018C3530D|nr:aldo/keto reductase [Methylomonas sp. LL1]QPK64700.1 aldo/keto reductase [Methylomonas sp. LL1]